MADATLQIQVTGNGDDAMAMLTRIADATEKLASQVKTVGDDKGTSTTSALDTVESKLNAIGQLPGPIGDLFKQMADAVSGVGAAGTAAGTALDVAFSPVTITIGLIVAAVGGLILALGALASAGMNAVNAFADWGSQVHDIQALTGMTAEYASTLAYVGEVAGQQPAQIEQMAAAEARTFYAANEQLAKQQENTAAAQQSAADKESQLASDHGDKLVSIASATKDKLDQLAESHTQKVEDLNQREADSEAQLTDQLDQLAQSHADKVEQLDQSIADLEDSYAQKQADRQQALQDQLEQIDSSRTTGRESLQQRLQTASDQYEKAGVQAQLAAYDQETAAEKAKAEQKAAEQDAKDKAAEDKAISKLQEKINRENALYEAQQKKLEEAETKRETALQASIAKENAAYEQQTAKVEAEQQKQIESINKSYSTQVAAVQNQLADFMRKAAENAPPVVKAIGDMGLNWDEINKLAPDERMNAILKALGKMPDSADKAAIEMKVFGRAGSDINELARVYSEETLPDWMTQTDKANKLLSQDGVNASLKYREEQQKLQQNWESILMTIAKDLMPALTTLETKLEKFWQTDGPKVLDILSQFVTYILPPMIDGLGKLIDLMDKLAGGQGQSGILSGIGEVRVAANSIPTSPGDVISLFLMQLMKRAGVPGLASGGSVNAGQLYQVGENGPEFLIPGQNGQIVPQGAGNGAAGSNTIHNWNITINHPHQDESSVLDDLRRIQRLVRY